MKTTIGAVLFGCLAALCPSAARAAEPRSHDSGFFLRLAPGYGFASSKIEEGPDSLELRGLSGGFDAAIGAVVRRNLAVHATLGGWALVDPTVKFNGRESDSEDVSLTLIIIGGGVTYYFRSNVYLTASAGAATLTLEFEGDEEESDTGFALDAGLGKEWWVGDRWGLGVSATVGYHSVPPGDSASRFKGPSFAVRFSATRN